MIFDKLKNRLGDIGEDWILLGSISPAGRLELYADEQPFKTEAGWTVLYFAPQHHKSKSANKVAGNNPRPVDLSADPV